MPLSHRHIAAVLVTGWLLLSSSAQANPPESYGESVGRKLGSSLANMTTGALEIPKTMVNTTNDSNVVYGILGGAIKGVVNTGGRLAVGVLDLITAPIPTQAIVYPVVVWDDFSAETRYGPIMKGQ